MPLFLIDAFLVFVYGLMKDGEIQRLMDNLPPDKKPDDGAALARELVRQGMV